MPDDYFVFAIKSYTTLKKLCPVAGVHHAPPLKGTRHGRERNADAQRAMHPARDNCRWRLDQFLQHKCPNQALEIEMYPQTYASHKKTVPILLSLYINKIVEARPVNEQQGQHHELSCSSQPKGPGSRARCHDMPSGNYCIETNCRLYFIARSKHKAKNLKNSLKNLNARKN